MPPTRWLKLRGMWLIGKGKGIAKKDAKKRNYPLTKVDCGVNIYRLPDERLTGRAENRKKFEKIENSS